MAVGNYWLLRCQHDSYRYWRAIRWCGLSCTHDELPREVCMKANVNLLHVVSFTLESTGELAKLKGNEWVDSGKLIAGKLA